MAISCEGDSDSGDTCTNSNNQREFALYEESNLNISIDRLISVNLCRIPPKAAANMCAAAKGNTATSNTAAPLVPRQTRARSQETPAVIVDGAKTMKN